MAPTDCEKSQHNDVVRDVQETEFRSRMLESGIGAWICICAEFGLRHLLFRRRGRALQRTDFGRPQAGIRFSIATPITAFVC
jgi:hypothetical protein